MFQQKQLKKISLIGIMVFSLYSIQVHAWGVGDALDAVKKTGEKIGDVAGDVISNPATCAALGAGIGLLVTGDVKGVVGGGVIAAGLCGVVKTIQTQSGTEVEEEYKKAHGKLPASPRVVGHSVQTTQNDKPVTKVDKKGVFAIESFVKVVDGSQNKITKVEEEVALKFPNGNIKPFPKKTLNNNGSGAFTTTWNPKMKPGDLEGLDSGRYELVSTLYLNGEAQPSKTKTTTFRLAKIDNGFMFAAR